MTDLIGNENDEVAEPMELQELMTLAIQDVLADENPSILVDEFFEHFVEKNREETMQVLAMLDMPNEIIIEGLIQAQMHAFEELRKRAPAYLESMRAEVKSRIEAIRKNSH